MYKLVLNLVQADRESRPDAILWDYAYGTKENLTWCRSNSSLGPVAVPVLVEGNFEPPFALISIKKGDNQITLQAVPTDDTKLRVPVVCICDDAYLEECRFKPYIGSEVIRCTASGYEKESVRFARDDEIDAIYDIFYSDRASI